MANEPHISHFNLIIDGSQADGEVMDELLECSVENSLHLPDMATIKIHDAGFKWLDAELFAEGKTIEIQGGEEGTPLPTLFNGEITGVDLDLAAHGVPTIVIKCLGRLHRLHRGRFNRSFVQMTDSDIARKVGGEAGFSVTADSTSEVHDWVFQDNQTNWEFLSERAARNGFRLYAKGERELCFKKVSDSADGNVELDWGKDLRSFRPRVSASQQVDEVVVRGWDPKRKQAIVGTYRQPSGMPNVGRNGSGGEVARQAFGSAKMVVVDRPVTSTKEAEDIARSVCDSIGSTYLTGDGLCYGMPNLKPGMTVEIKNIGQKFSGKYYITTTTHTYTPAEGYTTTFAASGKQPKTLLSVLEGSKDIANSPSGGNILVGVVTDNNDPDKMGRVKVKYPTLTEDHTSFWARLASPMAGSNRGLYILPEIDDEVLVAFEHGDIHRPYVIGMLWNGKDALPETDVLGGGGVVDRRVFYSRIGHKICVDDKDGMGNITVQTKGNHVIVLDDENKKITVKTTNGHEISLEDSGNKMVMKNSSGDQVEILDSGIINITANHTINLSAIDINIEAISQVKMTALNVDVDADVNTTVKGGVLVDISAPIVKVNS